MASSIFMVSATMVLILACAAPSKGGSAATPEATSGMVLVSTAFREGEPIPAKYSGYGKNISPDLSWDSVPAGATSFVLICRDPDAPGGTFYHWVVFNIPDSVRALPEGIGRSATLPSGGIQGRNSFNRVGYDGPKPPSGTHRYYFDLYALNGRVALDQAATADRLIEAMKGRVLGQASLMGRYTR